MSTPLYISNAPAIELRNIMKHLQVGNVAKFEDLEGRIEFVCDDYITICVSPRDQMMILMLSLMRLNVVWLCIGKTGVMYWLNQSNSMANHIVAQLMITQAMNCYHLLKNDD